MYVQCYVYAIYNIFYTIQSSYYLVLTVVCMTVCNLTTCSVVKIIFKSILKILLKQCPRGKRSI